MGLNVERLAKVIAGDDDIDNPNRRWHEFGPMTARELAQAFVDEYDRLTALADDTTAQRGIDAAERIGRA